MGDLKEMDVTSGCGVAAKGERLDGIMGFLHRGRGNRAVVYGIVACGWRFLAGPVTMFLIGTRFTREVQGYYYTFGSLLALQVFVELGLSSVILQFASHEWAKLSLDRQGRIIGDQRALSRLVSLGRLAFRWYLVAGMILACGLGLWGYFFFSRSPTSGVVWVGPWFALCLFTGMNLGSLAVFSVLQGCDQVSQVYAFRMIQGVLTNLCLWAAILLGAGLWTAAISQAVGLVYVTAFLFMRYRTFFAPFLSAPSGARINWGLEIWPMQWKIGVSFMSGYFASWLFTPLLFHFHGPVIAGQFGMTWSLIMAGAFLASLWSATRAPQFGMLIARKEYAELDRLLFRVWTVSAVVLVGSALSVWLFVYLLTVTSQAFAARLVSPLATGLLAIGVVGSNFGTPLAVYLRAHKREPLMVVSLVLGALTAVFAWVLVRRLGAVGAAATYAGVNVLVALPWGLWIWHRCRTEWHVDEAVPERLRPVRPDAPVAFGE